MEKKLQDDDEDGDDDDDHDDDDEHNNGDISAKTATKIYLPTKCQVAYIFFAFSFSCYQEPNTVRAIMRWAEMMIFAAFQ